MNRRRYLQLALAGAIGFCAAPLRRRALAESRARPRFYLQIIPGGGIDSIFTTDPKTTKDVDSGLDVPYAATDIVEAQGVRLGPTFAQLARWAPRLAIVNSFRQNSANHPTGMVHTTRFKTHGTVSTPTLLDVLGARRGREAVANVSLGAPYTTGYSPSYLGEPTTFKFGPDPGLFGHFDKAAPDDLRFAAAALERQAARFGVRPTDEERQTKQNLLDSAAFMSRAAAIPTFSPVDWGIESDATFFGASKDLQRALWLFENSMSRCATIVIGAVLASLFDSHFSNTARQTFSTTYLAALLDRLFAELDRRIVDGRPLSEQTVVIVGSEIGRFPKLNNLSGKDHLPQAPYMFFGPWFQTGATYGGTGRNMVTVPVSTTTGHPERGGHLLRVDDIGTTLLHLDGADPTMHGYAGEHLSFLTGAT
jgi:hypothetical protein